MRTTCRHCRGPIVDESAPEGFCCTGCATVAALLSEQGLGRYYDLQNRPTSPVTLAARARDLAWLEGPLASAVATAKDGYAQLSVDVQNLRCSACVWLLTELFRRQPGAVEALIDPGVGRATLTFRAGETDVAAFVRAAERFGYGVGPTLKSEDDASDGTLTRLGICAALTMNSMIFTAAFYFGLAPKDGQVFELLRWLNLLLGAAVVVVGGSEFFVRAFQSLRLRIVPFELPIALGIGLSFAASTWLFFRDASTFSFFDTLCTFTTLMLVGRWLQQRVLVQNRRRLLADEGIAGLFARRLVDGRVQTVAAAKVEPGDTLLVPPGDLLVTPSLLLDDEGSFSLDWINGESVPRSFKQGEHVPAGAFNASRGAARMTALEPFAGSALLSLLEPKRSRDEVASGYGALLAAVSRWYVPAVLVLATATFLFWWPHGLTAALHATTAVLVVTCPCALGLAVPLAYQLTAAELRRRGLFVCRESFLDRAARVRRVAFDKTGTLTLGSLRVSNPREVEGLPLDAQRALYNLVCRSSHPRSQALLAALPGTAALFDPALKVMEIAGSGVEVTTADETLWRLGRPGWLGGEGDAAGNDLWLAKNGVICARFALEEQLRVDARHEISGLRSMGIDVAILSGDAVPRVDRVAHHLGLSEGSAVGELSPEGKAAWLRTHEGAASTLLVGDGLNDGPAMDEALCSGTPAIDRPTLAARADFYFLTPDLACIRQALRAAQDLRRTTRNILGAALLYNALALTSSMLGLVGPLAAALAMPASSVLILLYTVRATRLEGRREALARPVQNASPAVAAKEARA